MNLPKSYADVCYDCCQIEINNLQIYLLKNQKTNKEDVR